MIPPAFGLTPFSSEVALWLECEHGRVDLAQVATTFVVASAARDLPPCQAQVIVSVDGRKHTRSVRLINGMSADRTEAMILADDEHVPF